ncbi:aldehyde dehydrogenase (NADP(+)) [Roseimaritima sediminicola]|uniref:aldehyde dehydrogenase (NADP(+)) n=1 Tax=Roseimaritima sediminicola TaxID=2662066 RepID=UPI0012982DC0|nr:aldehyde dehydrogenase (NADP(+)) [Roseimaritima sediminicola]
MFPLHGHHLIGSQRSRKGDEPFQAFDPTTQLTLPTEFVDATRDEVGRALELADKAYPVLVESSPETRARLLEKIADGLEQSGDELLQYCHEETALPMPRLTAERARTVYQTRLIAAMLREGSWVDAKIDHGDPTRHPQPKPDVRSMLTGIGPVVVMGASNFPLAISVIGTDTTTALAAGCPVVVKGHPAHPGTCELLAGIAARAVQASGLPAGVFSLLQGRSHEVGQALVEHPATAAVAFTGSQAGGRALFDIAAGRPNPIPVYAETESINPVFVLPQALQQRGEAIAEAYVASVSMGCGQLCTKPAVLLLPPGEAASQLIDAVRRALGSVLPGNFLHAGIAAAFSHNVAQIRQLDGIEFLAPETDAQNFMESDAALPAGPADPPQVLIGVADFETVRREAQLRREIFGPFSMIIRCESLSQLEQAAAWFDGQLSATLHGTEADLSDHRPLVAALRRKAGRLVVNGFPTGVEVCHAIHHGGPYPATTHSHFTSIGPAAIKRFVRPICFQDFPDAALPEALQETNPHGLMRLVDGTLTRT